MKIVDGKLIMRSFCILATSAFVATVAAQERETSLDPVTVTATVQPMAASKTGRNLFVIRGEELANMPVHSIDELLRYLPGIEVQQRGPMGSQADIVIRGGTFQQVLVVLDGIRLNDPNTGHFNAYIPIAPSEIERIEVLKGASSAIHGSEAVGGVIHIITRSFNAKRGREAEQISATAAGGGYGLFTGGLGAHYQSGNTALSGGLLTAKADGLQGRGTRAYFNNHTASLSVSHFLSDAWSIAARSSFDRRNFAAQNFYTTFLSDTAREVVTTWWNQLRLLRQGSSNKFSLDLGFKQVKDHYAYNALTAPNENTSALWQALAVYELKLSGGASITTGLQAQQKRISSNDRGNNSLWQGAGFFILNWSVSDNLFFSPALRMDGNKVSGAQWVPQLNMAYTKGRWSLRGSWGKTIRDADFTERYNNYNKAFVPGGSIGNPALSPEKSFSYELGADYYAGKNLKLSTTAFRREQQDLIDWVTTPYAGMPRQQNLSPGGSYALAKNIASVSTSGVEMELQYTKTVGNNKRLYATFGGLWLESQSSEAQPSFYLLSHARWLANFNLVFTAGRFTIALNGIYKNRLPMEAHSINVKVEENSYMLNVKASWNALPQTLAVFVEVNNLTNQKGMDLLTALQPARWVSAGIKWNRMRKDE